MLKIECFYLENIRISESYEDILQSTPKKQGSDYFAGSVYDVKNRFLRHHVDGFSYNQSDPLVPGKYFAYKAAINKSVPIL